MGYGWSQSITNIRLLGALSSTLLIIGLIKFIGHEVFTVLGLITLLYLFKELGLMGRFNNTKIALLIIIAIIAFNYIATAVILALYGVIKVTVSQYSVITYLSPSMPLWLRYPFNQAALVYALIVAAWPLMIAFSYYLYHAINGLSRLHRYAGIALMIGAVLYIAIVGAFIMMISYVLLLIAWLMPSIDMRDNKSINFTRAHAIRIIAWSIALSLITLITLSSLLSASLNPQYGGLDPPVTGLVISSKHPMEYMALLNYSLVDLGITNQTYAPNSISILGYVPAASTPYHIKVVIGINSCSDLITVAPTSTDKTMYSIPYEMPPTPLNPPESQITYQGTAVRNVIKADEVSWTYTSALSVSDHEPVPNGFLLTCMLSNYDYSFPVNITVVIIIRTRSNYFTTNYRIGYVEVSFMINRTAIKLVSERNGSFTKSSINYVNIAPIIYLPLFTYYIIYDHEFYRKLLTGEFQ